MIRLVCTIIVAVVGCSTPDLKIIYQVADGVTGPTCGSADCGDVPMACDSVLFLRVLRPSDPNAPFISVCQEVPANVTHDLCAISQVNLPSTTLPRETLEVQVVVWPRDLVMNNETGLPDCTKFPVEFDATAGYPIAVGPDAAQPAFGGRAFYHPGDAETFVTLGCTDLPSINNAMCDGTNDIQVTATVGDFENLPFSVSTTVADRLLLRIGEPKPFDDGVRTGHAFAPSKELDRTVIGPTPVWGGGVDLEFQATACVQVTEDGAQTTAALRCADAKPEEKLIDIPGARLPKGTLDQVLNALSLNSFPEQGLTVGIVLDHVGNPASGFSVSATAGNVQYLSSDRSMPFDTKTSTSGIFVSTDAPYGTLFTSFQVNQVVTGIGGLVDGKVTVVVLQFDMPPGS